MDTLNLILIDPNAPLCMEWKEQFAALPSVEVVHCYFQELAAFDCMVSAANSIGIAGARWPSATGITSIRPNSLNGDTLLNARMPSEWAGI